MLNKRFLLIVSFLITTATLLLFASTYLLPKVLAVCPSDPINAPYDPCANFGTDAPDAWFQTREGDVHSQNDINDIIPTTAPTPFLSTGQQTPGIVTYGNTASFSEGNVSKKGWLANSSYAASHYGYTFYKNKLNTTGTWPSPCNSSGTIDTSIQSGGIHCWDGDATLSQAISVPTNVASLVFVDGNATIDVDTSAGNRVVVNDGGFLAFIVSGNIIITPNVGEFPPSENPATISLEGIYITDQQFQIQKGSDPATERQLVVKGSVIAWGGMDFQRFLAENGKYPAQYFIYDPALVMNATNQLNRSVILYQQVGP